MEGNVEAINHEEQSVTIDGKKYLTSDKVNIEWVKKGKAEYSLDPTGKVITYIKHVKAETESSNFAGAKVVSSNDRQTSIVRQSCLKVAVEIAIANKNETQQIRADDVIAIAQELEEYVNDA